MACIFGGSTWLNKVFQAMHNIGCLALHGEPILIATADCPTDLTLYTNNLICSIDSIPVYLCTDKQLSNDILYCMLPDGTMTGVACVLSA